MSEKAVLTAVSREEIRRELEQFVSDYPEIQDPSDAIWGMVQDWLAGYRDAGPPYDLRSTFERWGIRQTVGCGDG
jgi:hypothetical protein